MLDWLGVMKDLEPRRWFTKDLILIDALTDKELTRISLRRAVRRQFRAPYTVVHRRDLHGRAAGACRRREEIALHTSKDLVGFEDAAMSWSPASPTDPNTRARAHRSGRAALARARDSNGRRPPNPPGT